MRITEDRKQELANTTVTLNGRPAVISGVETLVGTITDLKFGFAISWSWPTIDHIVRDRGGAFKF